MFPVGFLLHFETFSFHWKDKKILIYFNCITSVIYFFLQHQNVTYVPCRFFVTVLYKGFDIWTCFYYYCLNKIVFNSLIFWGWLFVTYGIDTKVLHSGIVPKPKLWYGAIPTADLSLSRLWSWSHLRDWSCPTWRTSLDPCWILFSLPKGQTGLWMTVASGAGPRAVGTERGRWSKW